MSDEIVFPDTFFPATVEMLKVCKLVRVDYIPRRGSIGAANSATSPRWSVK